MSKHLLYSMTYEEAKEYFSKHDIVILPIGSHEQHGPANPLGTDFLIADALAKEAAKRTGVAALPAIPFGVSFHHMHFPGTITIAEHVLEEYVLEVLKSLAKWGVKKVLIINGHGGNLNPLMIAARRAREEIGVKVYIYQWWTSSHEALAELFEPDERGHAAAAETSLNMYLNEQWVRKDKLKDETPKKLEPGDKVATYIYTVEKSSSGVFGKQQSANTERGRKLFNKLINDLTEIIEKIKKEKKQK